MAGAGSNQPSCLRIVISYGKLRRTSCVLRTTEPQGGAAGVIWVLIGSGIPNPGLVPCVVALFIKGHLHIRLPCALTCYMGDYVYDRLPVWQMCGWTRQVLSDQGPPCVRHICIPQPPLLPS